MPTNQSENKVRVTKLFGGGGGGIGWMDPKVGMVTDQGTISQIKDSGRFVVAVSGNGVGELKDCMAHDLFVAYTHATGTWAFPTGVGSVTFGRLNLWASGVPDIAESGMYYKKGTESGDGVYTFSR